MANIRKKYEDKTSEHSHNMLERSRVTITKCAGFVDQNCYDHVVAQRYSKVKYCINFAEPRAKSDKIVIWWDGATQVAPMAEFAAIYPEYMKLFPLSFVYLQGQSVAVPNSFEWFIANREAVFDVYNELGSCRMC